MLIDNRCDVYDKEGFSCGFYLQGFCKAYDGVGDALSGCCRRSVVTNQFFHCSTALLLITRGYRRPSSVHR